MKKKSIIILVLLIILSTVVEKVIGQKFIAQNTLKRAFVIDTITIKNACLITYYTSPDSKIFDFSSHMIITNDSCMREIQSKELKIMDVYPNLGYFTLNFRDVRSVIFYNDIKLGTSINEYKNTDNFTIFGRTTISENMSFKKYIKEETIFYVFLLQTSYFNSFCAENEKISDGNYVLVLVPKKPKQNIENNE